MKHRDAAEGRNPYLIEGPAQISFSGGRSSGMMLCKIVDAHQGTLPADVLVSFANTGKEREETLRFVQRVGEFLRVEINWLEYRGAEHQKDAWALVDFATAARAGEPFAAMIAKRGYLPNPVARICTQHLKIKPMEGLVRQRLGILPKDDTVANAAGIRADEPLRVARMRGRADVRFVLPLVDAGITSADVIAFWKAMPFDLELPSIDGATVHGNCDLCYLKGAGKLISLIREDPSRADWWIAQEAGGSLFRTDRPNYATMKLMATQPQLDFGVSEDTLPCECTD